MADSAVVGILRALLTADTAQFDAGMRKAVQTTHTTEKAIGGLGNEVKKLTPQAERMVKAFQGDKLLYQANNLVTALSKHGGVAKLTATEQARVNSTLNEAIAKYKVLGQQAPKALIDTEKATRAAAGPTQFLTTKMVALGAAVGTFASQLAGQAVRSIINIGIESFHTASQIVDLSNKTGLTTKTIQRMSQVADQTGTSIEAFTNASFMLGQRLAGGGNSVKKAAEDLGVEWGKLAKASPDEQFEIIVAALSKVTSAQERNRIGTELFGRSFREIAASVAEGYTTIANAAKLSSDAQIRSLDAAADRWQQFKTNFANQTRSALGDIILAIDEFNKLPLIQKPFVLASGSAGINQLARIGEARAIADSNKKKAAEDQARATELATKKDANYVEQLKKVQAELKNLDSGERNQIAAAQQLGAETDVITEMMVKFGVSGNNAEAALKLLGSETKKSGSIAKDAGNEWQHFIERFTGANTMQTALDLGKAIGTSQINLAKLTHDQQMDIKKALDEGADAWKAWGGVVPAQIEKALAAVNKFAHSVLVIQNDLKPNFGIETSLSDIGDQLEALERPRQIAEASAREHNKALRDLDLQRMEASIKQAEREGAKKSQILIMQSILAQKQRDADLADAEESFQQEIGQLQKTSDTYQQELDKRTQAHADHVQQINETWAQGEAERRDMIRRESSFWASELGKRIAGELKGINQELTGKLASTLFGGVDSEAKQRAKEAREDYERIAKSGTASAEEITRAFRAMRQAESEAHSRFADKFKSMWDGIKRHLFNIFDEILGAFVNKLLKGMLAKLAATNLGGKLLGFLGLGGGGSGGGLLGAGGDIAMSAGGALLGGGPAAAGSLGTLAGAPIFGASGAAIGTAGGTTAGAATGAAAGGGGAGLGAGIAALASNPFTIAAAAAVGGLFLINKLMGPGAKDIEHSIAHKIREPRIDIPQNSRVAEQMAATRSLRTNGGALVPRDPQSIFSPTYHITVQTPDAEGFERIWTDKLRPRFIRDVQMNAGQLGSTVRKVALT